MTRFDPTRYHRRSIRLQEYDYTQPGAYFVTICTHEQIPLFGRVADGHMAVNALGERVRECWLMIPSHFPHTSLDAFIIMPNHVHGIVWIVESPIDNSIIVGAKNFSPLPTTRHLPHASQRSSRHAPREPAKQPRGTSKTIGSIVRGFKIGVTKWAREQSAVRTVWQRNYYEHVIRTQRALNAIRRYVAENPLRWHLDRYNPDATGPDPLARELWRMLKEDTMTVSVGAQRCSVPTMRPARTADPDDREASL